MIDDDDKLRRNVVMFSAAVLAVAFLDLPIGSVAGKFLTSNTASVAPFRVWLMALLVLFYLVIRFSFPEKPSEAKPVQDWKRDFENGRQKARQRHLDAYFERRKTELATQEVQTYVYVDTPAPYRMPQPKSKIRPKNDNWRVTEFRVQQGKFWSGTLISVYYPENISGLMDPHEIWDEFSVPIRQAVAANLRFAFLSTVYSHTAANWLFPRVLAVLATLCISVKLVHTW